MLQVYRLLSATIPIASLCVLSFLLIYAPPVQAAPVLLGDACGQPEELEAPEAIEVWIFIEDSDFAHQADPNGVFRKELTHLLLDLLFIDASVHDVNHQISIWTYGQAPVGVSEFAVLVDVNSASHSSLHNLHRAIDNIPFDNKDKPVIDEHIELLFTDGIAPRIDRTGQQTLVVVLNDMTPNGQEGDSTFAVTALGSWLASQPSPSYPPPSIYLINFNEALDETTTITRWKREFFGENDPNSQYIHGGFRTLTSDNKLHELTRLFSEATGRDVFEPLTAAPHRLKSCPFAPEMRYGLLFETPVTQNGPDHNELIPGGQDILAGEYGLFALIPLTSDEFTLPSNDDQQDLDIYYTLAIVGGANVTCPVPSTVVAGTQVSLSIAPDPNSNLTVLWGPTGGDIQKFPFTPPSLSLPVPDVSQEIAYTLRIEGENPNRSYVCPEITVAPRVQLDIISLSKLKVGEPFTATIVLSPTNQFLGDPRPEVTLVSHSEATAVQPSEFSFISADHFQYTFSELPAGQGAVVASLAGQTRNDVWVQLHDAWAIPVTVTLGSLPTLDVKLNISTTLTESRSLPATGTLPLDYTFPGLTLQIDANPTLPYDSEAIIVQVDKPWIWMPIAVIVVGATMLAFIIWEQLRLIFHQTSRLGRVWAATGQRIINCFLPTQTTEEETPSIQTTEEETPFSATPPVGQVTVPSTVAEETVVFWAALLTLIPVITAAISLLNASYWRLHFFGALAIAAFMLVVVLLKGLGPQQNTLSVTDVILTVLGSVVLPSLIRFLAPLPYVITVSKWLSENYEWIFIIVITILYMVFSVCILYRAGKAGEHGE